MSSLDDQEYEGLVIPDGWQVETLATGYLVARDYARGGKWIPVTVKLITRWEKEHARLVELKEDNKTE